MATNQAQNGIAAPIEALFAAYLCSGLSSRCQSKLAEGFLQLDGTLSMRAAKLWKPFCENLLCAGALGAEKATHVQHEKQDARWMAGHAVCVYIDFAHVWRGRHNSGMKLLRRLSAASA